MNLSQSLRFPKRESPSLLRVTQSCALLPRAGSRESSDASGVFDFGKATFSYCILDKSLRKQYATLKPLEVFGFRSLSLICVEK